MSSGLCKTLEGAVAPVKVETVKDRIDNLVDAGPIYKTDHRAIPTTDFVLCLYSFGKRM
jgi:hypothetical protein